MYKIKIEKQGKSYPYNLDMNSESLSDEPKITTKIKPLLNKSDQNAEIEKGELVLDPKTGTIHKALGKPHSQGGTPVNLKDNSFIFSNFKDLAISKKKKELFEFKMGGNKAKNNTPAKILDKEIDLKHHNMMVDILQNTKDHNGITVNSAKLMMMKNLEKAGQVAYLQETMKNAQVPDFAKDTAPVYSKETDEKITQSMQYLQTGGTKKLTAEEIIRARRNKLADIKGWKFRYKEGKISYFERPGSTTPGKKMTNQDWINFLKNESAQYKATRLSKQQNNLGYIEDNINVVPTTPVLPKVAAPAPIIPSFTPISAQKITQAAPPTPPKTGEKPGEPKGFTDATNYKSKLTPWQKINMAIPFYRALTVKTQYPLRQHQESLIPQLQNMNVQPMLDANNQAYFNAANLTRTMNPSQGSQYLQQMYGNRLTANTQAIGQVQGVNITTQNRQSELAAKSLNDDAGQNRLYDKGFYDDTQKAIKNTRDLKEAYEQQGVQGINDTMAKKLAFDSWLNSQQQYRGKKTKIIDGVQHYQGEAPYTTAPNFWGQTTQHNPNLNIDWANWQSAQNQTDDLSDAEVQGLRDRLPGITNKEILDYLAKRKDTRSRAAQPPLRTEKMGGKYRKSFYS